MERPEAVIFDLDGTLVDSRRAIIQSIRAALAEERVHGITDQEILGQVGGGTRACIAFLLGKAEHEVSEGRLQDLVAIKNREHARAAGMIPLLPGVEDVLGKCGSLGVRRAVATMSSREVLTALMDRHGLRDRFEATSTIDEVSRAKPDPEILLLCAEKLGVSADRCVCVGDAWHDLGASRRAGMAFVWVDSAVFEVDQVRMEELRRCANLTLGPGELGSLPDHWTVD